VIILSPTSYPATVTASSKVTPERTEAYMGGEEPGSDAEAD
jgi:hypothetical protein